MCAIVDKNVVGLVFRSDQNYSPADKLFFDWLNTGRGRLVVGGKVLDELKEAAEFRNWSVQAIQAGRLLQFDNSEVDELTEKIRQSDVCLSDDEHVIALAQISGARLLFTHDGNLQSDFKNSKLIKSPNGSVYSTRENDEATKSKRQQLQNAKRKAK